MALEGSFTCQGRACELQLNAGGLTWRLPDSPNAVYHVPARQIVSCWCCPKGSISCCPSLADVFSDTQASTNFSTKAHDNYGFQGNSPYHLVSNRTSLSDVDVSAQTLVNNTSESPGFPRSSLVSPVPDPVISSAFDDTADGDESNNLALLCKDMSPQPCKHSKKHTTALAIEVCERVVPLSKWCSSSHNSQFVTDWTTRVFVFSHDQRDVVVNWYRSLWKTILGAPSRPRCLVAIVNPLGGKKTCGAIYDRHVAPLLRRAAIPVTMYTTTHSGHAETLAEEAAETPGVDGVVVVGGDGVLAEAANGLLKYACKVQGAKLDDRRANLPRTTTKLSAIPGGSTNAFFMSLQGTDSPVTATLLVIMGCNMDVDVGAVYAEDRLVKFTICGLHVGFLGAILETSVKLRSLGPIRDVIGATKEIVRNRSYACSLRFQEPKEKHSSPYDNTVCTAECRVCEASATDDASGTWIERKGDYHLVMMPLQSLECRYCKYGVSPACHSRDGTADLILVPKSSMAGVVSDKLTLVHFGDHLRRTSVEAFRSNEIQCKMDPSVPINFDGELRYYSNFVLRVHRQRLAMFCRGKEPVSTLDMSRASNNF